MSMSCRVAAGVCRGSSSLRSRRVFPAGQVERVDLLLELERVGQRVQQEVTGSEVACGGPDAPAGDELEHGA
jgi:hypothetical protein